MEKVIIQARSDKWLMARYPDAPDYLETLRDTLGRMSEINRLKWDDVNLEEKYLVLYTRKIDGGLSPRKIPDDSETVRDSCTKVCAERL